MVEDHCDEEGGRYEDLVDGEDATLVQEDGDEGEEVHDGDLVVGASRDLEVRDLEESVLLCEKVEAD